MKETEARTCMRCGCNLPRGDLSYVIQIKVFAGFDEWLLEPKGGVDQQLEELMKQVEQSDPETLEKEVYEEITLILCKSCRDRFVHEIQHPWEGPFPIPMDPRRIIH